MRKGYIAAVPDMFHEADRLSGRKSMEIIHKDNSIMIYENIDPDHVLVKPGSTVYPGQPLGLAGENPVLEVYLYEIKKDNSVEKLDIDYAVDETKTCKFKDISENLKVNHPLKIITREMTKAEIRNLKKN